VSTSKQYPWKRFWCSRGGSFTLDHQGYLLDPEAISYFTGVVPFEDIANHPCLVLLGEPGIGKSKALEAERTKIEKAVEEKGESLLWVDLKRFGDESRLLSKSFESKKFIEWAKGEHILHIFLDSLDECRLRVPHVAAMLMEQLREAGAQIDRLRLRIACRTAEWPVQLEEGLPELWGQERVGTFELAPLRRTDIHLAAGIEGLNPEAFLGEVEGKDAQPLAIKPVTLHFLIDVYRRDGSFPSRQSDLYLEGCRALAEESSASRRDAMQTGRLSPRQRLAVAARIAAVSMFCKKVAIYVGTATSKASVDEVGIDELTGGAEAVNADTFSIGDAEIREVLDTGLFSSRGPHSLGFAHQTYAEFLAAYYLMAHGLDTKQALVILRHQEDSGGAVVPQLTETAAWLGSLNQEVFREILRSDPKILLRSDVAQATAEDREWLVASLLGLFVAQELSGAWDFRDGYRKLMHSGLARQLTPFILLGPDAWLARLVAIDIAGSCNLVEMQDLLLGIALDSQEHLPTRAVAVAALARIGDESRLKQLMPLAIGVAEDSSDMLKGEAMEALWPRLISAKDLFAALAPVRDRSRVGSYLMFLKNSLLPGLKKEDLLQALYWVREQSLPMDSLSPFKPLADEIIVKSLENEPGFNNIYGPLSEVLLAQSKSMDHIQEPRLIGKAESLLQDSARRQLMEGVISQEGDFNDKRDCLLYTQPRLARPEDLDWVLSKVREATSEKAVRNWAELAYAIFYLGKPGHASSILTASVASPVLATVFREFLGSVALDSEDASTRRQRYQAASGLQEKKPKRKLLRRSPKVRIEGCLEDFEGGNLDAWWLLVQEMTLEDTSTHYMNESEPRLVRLPGWRDADEATRVRILQAARVFVLLREATPQRWFGKAVFFRPDWAGYKALCLLATEDSAFLAGLTSEIWRRWVPMVLGYPLGPVGTDSGDDAVLHEEMVARAYHQSPEAFLGFLSKVIDRESRKYDHLFILRRLRRCFDETLIAALCKRARQLRLGPGALRNILEKLIDLRSSEAEKFARSLARPPIPGAPKRRARSLAAALALLGHAPDAGWQTLKLALAADSQWGRDLFEQVGNSYHGFQSVAQRLREDEVADLYLWLTREYPQQDDPEWSGYIGPRHRIASFRDGLLNALRERGSSAACRELERLVRSIPELKFLKSYLLTARQNMLRKTWVPLSPPIFLQFSRHRGARLIRSADDLLEIILESLEKLQEKLQGKSFMARFLWDGLRPKVEEDLSDWIKVHLDEELRAAGIVALREVQIERGEKTDLHVTAQVPGFEPNTWEPVSVIIEVKGSWHPKVRTAMKGQLVETYLKNNGDCRHGLYLVGWYRCDGWDSVDSRARAHKTWTWEAAKQELPAQAESLSQEGRTVRAFLLDARLRSAKRLPSSPSRSNRRRPK
jgi:hypothetical protein